MKETRLDLGGLELCAVHHGPDDAPPLLALHGWLDNAASFAELAQHLPERRLIALDLAGHGHSGHLPQGPSIRYNFVDAVSVVLAASKALGLTHFDLLGHSMGAGIGSLLAAAAPDRIRRLALIEGLGPLPDHPESTLKRFRGGIVKDKDARALRVFPDINSAIQARHRASGLPPDHARAIVERGLRSVEGGYSWRSDPRLTDIRPMRMTEGQARRILAGIQSPTLLLLARPQTRYLPTAAIEARVAQVADIRVQHLDGHHHLHLEHPVEVASRIEAFLAG